MKKIITKVMLCLAMAGGSLLHAQSGPTPYPDAKDDAAWPGRGPIRVFGWMSQNRDYFWTQRDKAQSAVVFTGDSLVGNWKHPAMAAAFPGLKVVNRGIGGDVTRGLLFRFKEDVLDLNPKAIVICIGTNDLSAHADPEAIIGNIGLILDQARAHDAAMPVVLCTIPPRANPKAPLEHADSVTDLNQRIVALAKGRDHVIVFNLFSALADDAGKPRPEYFNPDLLHPRPAGYERWASLLAPVLASLKLATP